MKTQTYFERRQKDFGMTMMTYHSETMRSSRSKSTVNQLSLHKFTPSNRLIPVRVDWLRILIFQRETRIDLILGSSNVDASARAMAVRALVNSVAGKELSDIRHGETLEVAMFSFARINVDTIRSALISRIQLSLATESQSKPQRDFITSPTSSHPSRAISVSRTSQLASWKNSYNINGAVGGQ